MADSDGEYVAEELSDDDIEAHHIAGGHGTRSGGHLSGPLSSATRGGDRDTGGNRRRAAWEDIQRSWDTVVEGADGSINSTVEGLRDAGKRKRLLRDTTPLQRGIIRHLIVVLDLSFAMTEKDLRPTRYLLTLRYASSFITEFFEQNPISQLGLIGMRDGLAIRISDMSGNPIQHISALSKLRTSDPGGSPSLQNALEMARAALFHTPSHGTREILIVYGALLSSDPGDIHDTINSLVQDRIRVSVIGLAASVKICEDLCKRTNSGDEGSYHVALDEQHFRELVMAVTTPPVTRSKKQSQSSLLMMGFPSRTLGASTNTATAGKAVGKGLTLCACHSELSRGGYNCSRCGSRVCSLPAECPACGLTLILSTHLARSYHHLFPLKNWVEVSWARAARSKSENCYACQSRFAEVPRGDHHDPTGLDRVPVKGMSESGRYACTVCGNHFCIDCDVFAHEIVHNCPGCQSDTRAENAVAQNGGGVGEGGLGEDDIYGMEAMVE